MALSLPVWPIIGLLGIIAGVFGMAGVPGLPGFDLPMPGNLRLTAALTLAFSDEVPNWLTRLRAALA
jgi:hypothetical protein